MDLITIKDLLALSAHKYKNKLAFQIRKESNGYRKFTFGQVAREVVKVQAALRELGVSKGDRVALLSESRPEWPISYLAIASMGAIVVPLDAMFFHVDIITLLNDSGAKAIILSQKFKDSIRGTKVERQEIVMEDFANLSYPSEPIVSHVSLDNPAAIIYTSGTTGVPKGVVLTHKNLMSNVVAVTSSDKLDPKDNFLSVLPLHHIFETTVGFLGPFYAGCTITHAESLKSHNILQNMRETNVTIMCGVPLLYQLFYDGIQREVEEKGLKFVFSLLFSISKFFKLIIGVNLGRHIFKTVHKKFGGKIRFFVSGGAAIDPDLLKNFDLMGFTILQGYGLTESSPVLTCCTLKNNKLGSVGRPVPGVEVKISGVEPVGEILAFGPNIMKGYFKRKELTSRVVINGWLHTGDVGYFDEEGYLFITGRSKDIIVTGAGVNVYPEEIEFELNKFYVIKESCVMGQKIAEGVRKGSEEVVAIIVPEMEYFEGMTDDKFIYKVIKEEVDGLNSRMADFKRIARIIIRKKELPKTRLMKVKRAEIKKEMVM